MSNREYYGILAGWLVVVGFAVLWMWLTVKKGDKQRAADEAKQRSA